MVTLDQNTVGIYEMPIKADVPTIFTIPSPNDYTRNALTITHHQGDNPIYFIAVAREDLEPGDPNTQMLMPSTWVDVTVYPRSGQAAITLVSHSDAVVSVARG